MRNSFQQGHSRRLQVSVKPVQNSGTLPLLVEAVLSVSIGCVSARSTKLQRPLDSYQVCETHTDGSDHKKILSLYLYVGTIKHKTVQNNNAPCWVHVRDWHLHPLYQHQLSSLRVE